MKFNWQHTGIQTIVISKKETNASVVFVLLFKLEIESCFIFIFLSRRFSRKLKESLSQAFQLLTDGLTHFRWNSSVV